MTRRADQEETQLTRVPAGIQVNGGQNTIVADPPQRKKLSSGNFCGMRATGRPEPNSIEVGAGVESGPKAPTAS